MPISPLVVRDVSLHLVLNNFIWQEYPFNPGNLQPWEIVSSSGRENKNKGGAEHNCKLFRLKSSWRSGSDRERSVLPSDCFLFIFLTGSARIKTAHAAQRWFYLYACTDSHVKSAWFLHPIQGIVLGVKVCEGQRRVSITNADGCVNPGLSEPPGTHENNLEWYPHVVTCSPAVWLDLDGRSDDLKSDPAQCCVVQHQCQAKR